jgi:hypothetical protein
MRYWGNPIKKLINKNPAVNPVSDSSSMFSHGSAGIFCRRRSARRSPTGMVRIHKAEVREIRRRASHWAILMGREMTRVDTTILLIVIRKGDIRVNNAKAPQPRMLATCQMRNGLNRSLDG